MDERDQEVLVVEQRGEERDALLDVGLSRAGGLGRRGKKGKRERGEQK
jgi:hypothetical protein